MIPDPEQVLASSRWIWVDSDPAESNVWAYFRRRIEIRSPRDTWLNICADLRYLAWINGRMLGFGPPRYHLSTPTVDRYSLEEFLSPGANLICVLVYSLGRVTDISSCMPRRGALLAAIEADGAIVPTNSQWRARRETAYLTTAIRRGEFQPHNEVFDARLAIGEPWRNEYEDANWPAAVELSTSPLMEPWEKLEWRDIPPIGWSTHPPDRLIETGIAHYGQAAEPARVEDVARQIASASRRPDADARICLAHHLSIQLDTRGMPPDEGCYARWDFGRLWTGYPVIELSGTPGTIVDLSYGEHLSQGRIDPQKHGLHYFDRLILDNRPLRHRIFWPKCLRYLQADVRGGLADIQSVALEVSAYPVQFRGGFHSSDATLDQAWQIAAHTLGLCMEDSYMDTPWRERGAWLGDIIPQAHGNYYAFGDSALHRRFLVHHARGQLADGRMHGKYPGYGEHDIPTWSLTYALSLDQYIRYSGDAGLARELWPTCWRIAQWLETHLTAEGLYGNFPIEVTETVNRYVFIDWAPVNTAGANAALNAFAYAFFDACEHLAGWAGERRQQAICRDRRRRLGEAYALFWDRRRGVFVNGRDQGRHHPRWGVQENMLAVLFGLTDERQRESIIGRLKAEDLLSIFIPQASAYDLPSSTWAIAVNQYRWDDRRMVPLGTPYFAYWAALALCEMGMLQPALDLVRRHWGNFSRQGGTSTWEQWDTQGSLSHGWGTAPILICGQYILGVSVSRDDPKHLCIIPQRADLGRASGRIGLPLGTVGVDWRWDGRWEMHLDLPQPFCADVGFVSQEAPHVRVNGRTVETTPLRHSATQFNVTQLHAGRYRITGGAEASD